MRTIVVSRTNLFAIAAAMLGDATLWVSIARANDLRDPFIDDLREVKVPDARAGARGDSATF